MVVVLLLNLSGSINDKNIINFAIKNKISHYTLLKIDYLNIENKK